MVSDVIPRKEYPRPDFKRSEWINLNGKWEFEFDYGNSGIERNFFLNEKKFSDEILVPFCAESNLSGIGNKDFMVSVWCRKRIEIPEKWNKKRIFLNFGAVDFKASVWINEKFVGSHIGGYAPFSFDITEFLKRGTNVITVNAYDDNRTGLQPAGKQSSKYNSHGCYYTRVTGIWQTVWLEARDKIHLKNFKVFPDIENERVSISFEITGSADVKIEIFANGEKIGNYISKVNRTGFANIPLRKIFLWSPENPYLYDIKISLYSKGEIVDEVWSYFGMREIKIEGKRIFLNGKPIFMRMVLDQGYYPDGIYTAPSEEDLKNDIIIAKKMGFNGARLHQKVFEPLFLYWADKLGYLVWGEYPNWGLKNRISEESFHIIVEEWTDVLERDFNHPSIMGWCPLNETPPNRNPELLKILYKTTKKIDSTRPVIDTSGYVHVVTDIYDCHNYTQEPEKFSELFEPFKEKDEVWRNFPQHDAEYKGQPYWVSEYGGIWWAPKQKDEKSWGYGERPKSKKKFLTRCKKLTEILLSHPKICGFCYTQLYDVEQEVNGLYTYERKPKFDPEIIKRINQKKATIER